ncbi:MAG: CapA family protein [Clostridia bacterium]|nr:CapA family protein [Clostridia bacterium]
MKRLMALLLVLCMLPAATLAEKKIRINFTGDVTLGSEEQNKDKPTSFVSYAKKYGYDYFFTNVREMFMADDLTVVNLEGPLTDSSKQENKKKTFRFRGPTDFVNILLQSGIEAVSLANNHTKDFGKQGFHSTQETLTQAKVGWFMEKDVYLFEKDGIRIAFLSLNATAVNSHKEFMKTEIKRLKEEVGVNAVVYIFHMGSEYSRRHNKAQEQAGKMAIDAGADLVVMHHPHVVQGMEIYKNRTICYSLGNFCFGGNKTIKDMESMVLGAELTFADDGTYLGQQLTIWPANISGTEPDSNFQPLLVKGEAADKVMRKIQLDTAFELAPFDEEAGCAVQPYLAAE